MKRQTLVSRALNFLKGGDEAKLDRFESKLGKYFKEQINIREREIEKLSDKLEDLTEILKETIPNVDLDKISKSESLEAYIPTYVALLDQRFRAVEDIQDKIDIQQAEIDRYNAIEALIYAEDEVAEIPNFDRATS